jgi:hypothetical protein
MGRDKKYSPTRELTHLLYEATDLRLCAPQFRYDPSHPDGGLWTGGTNSNKNLHDIGHPASASVVDKLPPLVAALVTEDNVPQYELVDGRLRGKKSQGINRSTKSHGQLKALDNANAEILERYRKAFTVSDFLDDDPPENGGLSPEELLTGMTVKRQLDEG